MSLLNTLRFLVRHPLNADRKLYALKRFAAWQLGSRLSPGSVAVDFVDDARLLVARGMKGATGNVYTGLHEFDDMGFLLHVLRPDDGFVDIGANVGTYTVLAGKAVGAQCISIEPIPATFASLLDNIRLNDLSGRVRALNLGLGRTSDRLRFTARLDTTNHVVGDGEAVGEVVEVPVEPLDRVLDGVVPQLIKIDVEGFEAEVIAGAHATLSNEALLAVIMETNGAGQRYGNADEGLHEAMLGFGFESFRYAPLDRTLTSLDSGFNTIGNTLYIRDAALVRERTRTAPRFDVQGVSL